MGLQTRPALSTPLQPPPLPPQGPSCLQQSRQPVPRPLLASSGSVGLHFLPSPTLWVAVGDSGRFSCVTATTKGQELFPAIDPSPGRVFRQAKAGLPASLCARGPWFLMLALVQTTHFTPSPSEPLNRKALDLIHPLGRNSSTARGWTFFVSTSHALDNVIVHNSLLYKQMKSRLSSSSGVSLSMTASRALLGLPTMLI